ncbi:hypothetical protein [uncultured Williamsia sp.]|uniref:hypothetical protein n=1 Tax=uncultured Williamsia sp. TaxID=259311 RepID=UPI0026322419|nr:hypothetical protein [uncultured Williamsia sp.]
MSQVLGVSVTDLQVASVIMEAETGNVLARNTADLSDATPDSVLDAVTQLVETVPFEVEAITVACAQRSVQVALHNTITAGASGDPEWYRRTIVTDTPFAFANVAAAQSDQRGQVVVIDLADDAIPFNELSIAAVDTETATVVGAVQLPGGGQREPVTDPSGAATVGEAFRLLPVSETGRTGVFVVGPGAAVPGVAAALEYETQLPVQIAEAPTYAAAHGAALHGRTRLRTGSARTRWIILAGAALAALVLAIVVAVVVLVADSEDSPTPANSTESSSTTPTTTSTPSRTSSTPRPTTTTDTATQDQGTDTPTEAPAPPQTVTVTPPPQTVTRTTTPPPVTTTTPPTTTTTVPDPSGGAGGSPAASVVKPSSAG